MPAKSDAPDLGTLIRAHRDDKRLTGRGLAQKIGIAPSSLSNIERGEVPQPKPSTLDALARELGLDYLNLMRMAGYPVPPGGEATRPTNSIGEVTADEDVALRDYLAFLRWRGRSAPRD